MLKNGRDASDRQFIEYSLQFTHAEWFPKCFVRTPLFNGVVGMCVMTRDDNYTRLGIGSTNRIYDMYAITVLHNNVGNNYVKFRLVELLQTLGAAIDSGDLVPQVFKSILKGLKKVYIIINEKNACHLHILAQRWITQIQCCVRMMC